MFRLGNYLTVALFMVAWAVFSGWSVHAIEEKTVEVEGVGTIVNEDLGKARDEAIGDALRRAVEMGIGVLITSESEVKNYMLVRDQLLANSKGLVKNYEIIEEKRIGTALRVKIKATVTKSDVDEAIKLLMARKNFPRLMVVCTERVDNEERLGVVSQSAMENALLAEDFRLVDKDQMEEIKARDVVLSYEDYGKAAALGKRFGAEVIIVVKAEASFIKQEDLYGVLFAHYDAHVYAKAIRCDDASLIASESAKATKGSRGKQKAADDALETAAQQVVEKIIDRILNRWKADVNVGNRLQLVVNNIKYSQLRKLMQDLKQLRGAKNVMQRNFAQNIAVIEMDATWDAAQLADKISAMKDPGFEITGVSQNRVDAKVTK